MVDFHKTRPLKILVIKSFQFNIVWLFIYLFFFTNIEPDVKLKLVICKGVPAGSVLPKDFQFFNFWHLFVVNQKEILKIVLSQFYMKTFARE